MKIFFLIFAAAVSFSVFAYAEDNSVNAVYDNIIKSGTLRCGYFIEAPFTFTDPENPEKVIGISRDLVLKIAKELNLKVEFSEEINFASFPQDLNNGRYDAVCADVFILPRAGKVDYTIPYAIVPVYGYVRADDKRFDKKIDNVDWPRFSVSGLDGEGATTAAQKMLPEAKFNILPQQSQISDMLLNVASGKSDVAFVMPTVYADFEKNNKGRLKLAFKGEALYKYGAGFALPVKQAALKNMLDNSIRQLTISGELAALFDKYDPQRLLKTP